MQRRFKYFAKLGIGLFIFGVPFWAQAACVSNGYTVVFINGIQTSYADAKAESSKLEEYLGSSFNNQPVSTILGYNETHGLDADATKTALPALGQYDIDNILMNLQGQVQTRKMIIVGYSQGAMLASRLYDYLIKHGEPADDVQIYGVATPETILQNKGKYLNFEGDNVIYNPSLQVGAVVPPPPNVTWKDWWALVGATGDAVGHSFITEYLDNFSDRITSEIKAEMFTLHATNPTDTGGCFEAPPDTLGHKTNGVLLAAVKPVSVGLNITLTIGWDGLIGSIAFLSDTTSAVESFFSPSPSKNAADADRAINDAIFAAVKAIYGSSLDVQDVDQLQRDVQKKKNNSLSGAAILALMPDEAPSPGEVLGSSTKAASVTVVATSTANSTADPHAAMPGEVVHYNAPTFGGSAAVQEEVPPEEVSSSSPPALTAAELFAASPPAITFSNWRADDNGRFCNIYTRFVDVSWSAVPGATQYDVFDNDFRVGQGPQLLTTTADTSWPGFGIGFSSGTINPTEITVVAHDGAGNTATSTVRADQALDDRSPPNLLDGLLSPPLASTGVLVGTSIKIPFDERLASSTVTGNTFALGRIGDAVRVDASASLSADGATVTLTPVQPLQYSSRYNISIACTVSDIYGNRLPGDIGLMVDPSVQYFTTEADPGDVVE